jgi:CBS domain containing-hemolysin-like protein
MIAAAHWTSWLGWSALMVLGVVMTALYAGLETGIYVLNKIRLDLRAETGSRPARILRAHLANPSRLLALLLVGTNVANYIATFGVGAMFVLAGAGHGAEWYTLAVTTPMLFILSESVPKNVFRQAAERLVYRLAWLLAASSVLFRACGLAPLVRGFGWLVMHLAQMGRRRDPAWHQRGLDAIMAEGAASGVLTHYQSDMARRVVNIAEVTLAHVMVPMSRAVSAPRDVSAEQFLQRLRGHNYSRLPLLDADGHVVGVVDIYDVLTDPSHPAPAEKMSPPLILPATMNVPDALYRMQRARAVMIIVEDADGRHVGLATAKDLVEEIVGELAAW